MAEDLLYDADVHALFQEHGRRCVAGVMQPGVPDAGLIEDGLPFLPVFARIDRLTIPECEGQVEIRPLLPRAQPFAFLLCPVFLERDDEGLWKWNDPFPLSFGLHEVPATTYAIQALSCVSLAVWTARLRALPAVLLTAVQTVVLRSAHVRVTAAVLEPAPLDLPVNPEETVVQIDVPPPESQRLALPQPSARATDQRVPFQRFPTTLRIRRASSQRSARFPPPPQTGRR